MSDSSPGVSVSSPALLSVYEHIGVLPHLPFLPAEIWHIVLQKIRDIFRNCKSQDDLVHLWTCVRTVCKQFKAEVEDIFKTQHVPLVVLHFFTGQ